MKNVLLNIRKNASALCLLVFAFTGTTLLAQTGSVKGRVIDAETLEPLPFANIFINNTTLGAATSPEGTFQIKGIPAGQREIIVSFISYETYQIRTDIKNGLETTIDVKLVPVKQSLGEVEVKAKRDKVWERKLARFEKIFLGTDERGLQCRIINPYVIDFNESKENLIATATEPIEIENKALGYKVFYYLKTFTSDGSSYLITGNPRFQEMTPANASQAVLWTQNRKEAYFGSPRHLFKSIINNRVSEEGFRLYVHRGGNKSTGSFSNELLKSIFPFNITPDIVIQGNNNEYKLSLGDRIEVHYVNGPSLIPSYPDIGHSVSFLDLKKGPVVVTSEGIMLASHDVVFSGDLSVARVSSLLPLDYKETSVVRLKQVKEVEVRHMYEKVYLHTSKSYFYPSEIIWFKAYMNYAARGMADSLSRVLYVSLTDSVKNIIQTKTLRIDAAGTASGEFRLPKDMKPGTYALLAYTNWMKNFGSRHYFVKPVPVLDIYHKITGNERKDAVTGTRNIEVTFNKDSYNTREGVNAAISIMDQFERPTAASLSVSVTDISQVAVPSWTTENIVSDNAIPDELKAVKFTNRIERGVTWNGEFIPDVKKKAKADLTIVRGSFEEVKKVTTAEDGTFTLTDLDIQDSALFAFQALKKGERYGKVVSRHRDVPSFDFNPSSYTIPVEKTNALQRVLSVYEIPEDAILLESVEVKGKKIVETTATIDAPNPYGKADVTLDGKEIAKFGMENMLRKKAPGYRLAFNGIHWYLIHLRGEASLMAGEHRLTEPVLTIDNILQMTTIDDPVGSRLMNMNVNTIARVEISSVGGSNVGAQGGYGVIAVFTKKASYIDKDNFQPLYIKGFDTPGQFHGPDYSITNGDHSRHDARSTLYWNPSVIVNKEGHGEFSFYTSDMSGRYRVVMEGITAGGRVVHVERVIEVR